MCRTRELIGSQMRGNKPDKKLTAPNSSLRRARHSDDNNN